MRIYALTVAIVIVIVIPFRSVECGKKLDLDGLRDMLKPMAKSCVKKTGVSMEIIEGTHNGLFPRDKQLMCFFKCLSIMLKLMNKQGEVTMKNLNRQIDILVVDEYAPRMKEIGGICFDKMPPKSDACEYAFDLVLCGYEIDSRFYVVPKMS